MLYLWANGGIMEWTQVLTIVAANFAMFLWVRKEGNADRKELRAVIDAGDRRMNDFVREWAKETKDFHARLCLIEEGRK